MRLAIGADGFFPRQVFGDAYFFEPRLAAFPAEFGNHAACRHHRVRHAVLEIDLAVAVAVNAALKIILRQKLHHADFASPCASCGSIDDALIE
ncbi:hypothetical protein D3C80_1821870 [compost metagenome]